MEFLVSQKKSKLATLTGTEIKKIITRKEHSFRCELNNPCDHDCTDTGVAIKCSCNDGYELATDKRTCNGAVLKYFTINTQKLFTFRCR